MNKLNKSFFSILFIFCFCVFCFGQNPPTKPPVNAGNGIGSGSGDGKKSENIKSIVQPSVNDSPLRILSKPRPNYTDTARKNAVEGTIILRVTFLSSGDIGIVSPVSFLTDGLTEQAIEAARNIKFEPAKKDGIPVSLTKTIEYSFTIYFKENDKELAQNAEILEMPKPDSPPPGNAQKFAGKITVEVAFKPNGTAAFLRTNAELPKEYVQKIIEAVAKIKFTPAIHKNGNAVTQIKDIEYEFSEFNN